MVEAGGAPVRRVRRVREARDGIRPGARGEQGDIRTARSLGRRWKEWDWVLGAIDTMEVSVGTVDLG